jgi:hypothetical protein
MKHRMPPPLRAWTDAIVTHARPLTSPNCRKSPKSTNRISQFASLNEVRDRNNNSSS